MESFEHGTVVVIFSLLFGKIDHRLGLIQQKVLMYEVRIQKSCHCNDVRLPAQN